MKPKRRRLIEFIPKNIVCNIQIKCHYEFRHRRSTFHLKHATIEIANGEKISSLTQTPLSTLKWRSRWLRGKRINKSAFFSSYVHWCVSFSHFGIFLHFSFRSLCDGLFVLPSLCGINDGVVGRAVPCVWVCDAVLFWVFCFWASEPLKMSLNRWLALWLGIRLLSCVRFCRFCVIYENSSSNSSYILIMRSTNGRKLENRKSTAVLRAKMSCETRPQKRK